MLDHHDSKGPYSLSEKVEQVLHKDYGDFIVLDMDRFDFQFFESIDGGVLSKDKSKIYFVGIIDTLTYYGAKKSLEYNVKKIVQGSTISCIPPKRYGTRFFNYI